ncbi:MAG: hypothetical protein H6622_06400 [Halobacteriovoraceae bacterium]|nr:hypothetical protein [Halobacteriovoraceae bacterium]
MFRRLLIPYLIMPVALATQIYYPPQKKFIHLTIEKADPSSDVISVNGGRVYDLMSLNGITQVLACRFQDGPKSKPESFIEYKNFANLIVGRFYFSNHKECDSFVNYSDKIFEFINDENPIKIVLDIDKKQISKIYFPHLDPYTDYLPELGQKTEKKYNLESNILN